MDFKGKPKVIGIGFQKTGTSTLREMLRILGYAVRDNTPDMLVPILKNQWSYVFNYLDAYDAAEDTPWYKIYKEIDQAFPGSKFILTYRDPESWYKSVSRHIGDLRSAQHEWVYGRGKGLPKDDKDHTIAVYLKHIEEVRAYFEDRPKDLLIVDLTKGDGWEPICQFLNKPIPNTSIPHYNKADYSDKGDSTMRRFKMWRKKIKNGFKIRYISLLGLWD